ncbi:MAG: hypothetical protein SOZ34_09450, partial [Clostridia bacterium]|nr:hypothetical protein [Clostridia bacterium]
MKRITKKIVSMLTAAAICSTFSFSVAFAVSDYQSISLGKMQSVYSKGDTQELDVIVYDANGNEDFFEDYENCTFESSNEDVVAIDSVGTMTMKDYGVSSVTVKYGELSATMMITVTPKIHYFYDTESSGYGSAVQDSAYARRGSYSGKITVQESDIVSAQQDNGVVVAGKNALTHQTLMWRENQRSNLVCEGWFYDNGTAENAEAGIGFYVNNIYHNTGAIGIINSTDTTYKISGVHARWSKIWLPDDINNATDTGIARTKGWHQVTIVQANNSGNVVTNGYARSTSGVVYLDGKPVKDIGAGVTKWITLGYAGTEVGKTAYFDDISQNEYMYLDNVTLSVDETDGESLVANFEYLGASGPSVSTSYQWYYSDNRNSDSWTAIEGATSKTYKI